MGSLEEKQSLLLSKLTSDYHGADLYNSSAYIEGEISNLLDIFGGKSSHKK